MDCADESGNTEKMPERWKDSKLREGALSAIKNLSLALVATVFFMSRQG